MATLLSLKKRIQAAQNVSKTTRAMQMVAASKLKRAQDAAVSLRPYAQKLIKLSQNIVNKLDEDNLHEYMKQPKGATKTLLIVVSPDKGLCGSLITNIGYKLLDFNLSTSDVIFVTVGKKIERLVASLKQEIVASFNFGTTLPSFEKVYPLLTVINDYFLSGKVKEVKILNSDFLSVFSQKPKITNILPILLSKETENKTISVLFEPKPKELLPILLSHYLEIIVYESFLENFASEQSARMIAMRSATDNAVEIAGGLKLEYNKARQERITNEILDISSVSFAQLI